jgi:cation:H+ antiporter
MLQLILWLAVFLISLFILIKSADFFTDSAEEIGKFFGMPHFIIGVTIVAVGTSLPELISSIFAVLKDSSEIVVGNVIGSNIANILLILGITAIIGKKLTVKYEIIHIDLPLLMGSTFLFSITIIDKIFSIPESLICLAALIIYVIHAITSQEKKQFPSKKEIPIPKKKPLAIKTIIILLISGIFIYGSAKYTIESVIKLSEILNIGKEVIAAVGIALGTSLPELAVSITAVHKGESGIAIGNILGSNIFNLLAVMGIPALFGSLIIPLNILTFALPMLLIATFLFFFMTQDREITSSEGWLLIILYIFFIVKLLKLC